MCRPKFLQPNGGAIVGSDGNTQSLQNLQQFRQFPRLSGPPQPRPTPRPQSPEHDGEFLLRSPVFSERKKGEAFVQKPFVTQGRSRNPSPSSYSRASFARRNASPSPTRKLPVQHVQHVQSQTEFAEVTALQRGIASCAGTVFMSVFMTPLDVVKVRLQAQQQPSTLVRSFRSVFSSHPSSTVNLVPCRNYTCIPATHSHSHNSFPSSASTCRFNGTVDAFVKIVTKEGFCRLWSGLTPALLMRIPSNVIYFSVYEKLKTSMGFQPGKTDKNSVLITLSASGTARAVSVTAVSPIEMIRTKMQAEPMSYADLAKCLRQAVRGDGLSSLWRGLGPMLSRDVMYAVLYWTHYELLKAEMCKICHTDKPTVTMTFWAGAASGVLAAVISTPCDVVKTQKQITIGKTVSSKGPGSGALQCRANSLTIMRMIFAEAGMKGLFAGTLPRICKGAPSSAILITTYEYFISQFRKYNLEKGY